VAGGLATFILPQLIPLFVGMHIPLPFATKVLIEGASFLKTHWFVLLVGLCVFSVFYIYLRRIPPVRYYLDRFRLKVPFLGPLEEAHQLTVSARVIATLYESGIDVPGAIRIASGTCTNTVYVQAWATIAKVTESGEPVSTALTRYPHLFRNEFLLLTSVGEQSGTIAPTFRRLADHYEEQINLMIKRLPAVIEPLLLIMMTVLVGFVATAIMLPVYEFSTGFAR
jgi:type IV pilus assembly protein PilC